MRDSLFDLPPEQAGGRDLPPLSGSDRQRPWAEDVRTKKLAEIDRLLRDWQEYVTLLERTGKTEPAAREREALRAAIDASEGLLKRDTCRFWLDRRCNSGRELLAGAEPNPGNTYHPQPGEGS